jgi:tetratricopeptide (TPR) repeat protein
MPSWTMKNDSDAGGASVFQFTASDYLDYPFELGVGEYNKYNMIQFSTPVGVSGADAEAVQFWLKSGLLWYYAFNHEEAVECFKRALQICPNCPMGHWGVSVCHGPNYNTVSMTRNAFPSATDAYYFAVRAQELADAPGVGDALSPLEKTLIRALQVRFNPVPEEDDGQPVNQNTSAYEQALQAVWEQHQEVPCVGCMYAESLMNYSPWKLWDLNSGEPKPYAVTARSVLEACLARAPLHPGLLHFYIHLMEMSPWPHLALESSRALQPLVKHAGHLIHMPSHIYVLCGKVFEVLCVN